VTWQAELDEKKFPLALNEDAMATEKTAKCIRPVQRRGLKLERFIASGFVSWFGQCKLAKQLCLPRFERLGLLAL